MPRQLLRILKPQARSAGWLLSALLLTASVCHADELYKWREPDGTLTFSPNPPNDSSIAYEKVVSGQSQGQIIRPATTTGLAPSSSDLPAGLSHSAHSGATPTTANAIQRPPQQPNLTRSTQKTAQCEELKKRVISLERLLQTDISNETMDNAVVQMARYQSSFNQACNRRLSLR